LRGRSWLVWRHRRKVEEQKSGVVALVAGRVKAYSYQFLYGGKVFMIFHRTSKNDKWNLTNGGKLNLSKLTILPHEIVDICRIICAGAYGDPNQWGAFVYGKRPDGKTVRCKVSFFNKEISVGIEFPCVFVWSSYRTDKYSNDSALCTSVFHIEDWHKSGDFNESGQKEYLNNILRKRRIEAYQSLGKS